MPSPASRDSRCRQRAPGRLLADECPRQEKVTTSRRRGGSHSSRASTTPFAAHIDRGAHANRSHRIRSRCCSARITHAVPSHQADCTGPRPKVPCTILVMRRAAEGRACLAASALQTRQPYRAHQALSHTMSTPRGGSPVSAKRRALKSAAKAYQRARRHAQLSEAAERARARADSIHSRAQSRVPRGVRRSTPTHSDLSENVHTRTGTSRSAA
jgi:hypothetical protein